MRQRWCIALRLPVQLRANNQLEKTISKIYIYDIEKDILMPLLKNVSDCWFDGIIDNNKICYRENRDTKTRRRMIEHILEITES